MLDMRTRPMRLNTMEHAIVTWYLTVPPEVTLEDLLNPATWSHVAANQLRPFHRVVVDCEDGAWTREFFVQSVGRSEATLAMKSETIYDETVASVESAEPPKYIVQWKGPVHKHQVVRLSDGAVVAKDIPKMADAKRWIADRAHVEAA